MGLLKRIRAAIGTSIAPVGTPAIPMGQHEELTEAEKFKREHGFAAATEPDVWSPEIAAHNRAIDEEYAAEIERRKALLAAGQYTPRFYMVDFADDGTPIVSTEVNWHLELSMEPGRRTNLTNEPGQVLPLVSAADISAAIEADSLERKVVALEAAKALSPAELADSPALLRSLVSDRAAILAACRGSEAMADQLEAAFFRMLDEARGAIPPAGRD